MNIISALKSKRHAIRLDTEYGFLHWSDTNGRWIVSRATRRDYWSIKTFPDEELEDAISLLFDVGDQVIRGG